MWKDEYRQTAEDIVKYSALSYERMLVTAAGGNVSARIGDTVMVTRSGVSLREIGEGDLLVVDLRGNILHNPGNHRPSKETGFHLAIYNARESVRCVLHVHPPYVTAFSVNGTPFPRVTSGARNKLSPAPMIEPLRSGSQELLERVSETVLSSGEEVKALILQSHGTVAFDATMEDAFQTAELMEDCARVAYLALQIGTGMPGEAK